MDNSDLVETVFLDLSKAFDLVSHDILIARLSKNHTGPTAINLSEHRQVCSVSGVLSSPASLPQGSILGPELPFLSIMNDLPLLLKWTSMLTIQLLVKWSYLN